MRKTLCVVVLLALVTPAFAADDFAGTWKINREKSTGPVPTTVEELVTVEEGDGHLFTLTGKGPDGAPYTSKFSVPNKGGAGKIIEGDSFEAVTAKPSTPKTEDFTFSTKGKPMTHVHSVLSSDGKTMTSTVHVMSGGRQKPGNYKDVWDKQ